MSPRVDLGEMHRLGEQVRAVNELHQKAESDGLCLECGGVWPCRTRNAMNEAFNDVNAHLRGKRSYNRDVWKHLEMRPHVDSADCWCEPVVNTEALMEFGKEEPIKRWETYEHTTPDPVGPLLVDPRIAAKSGQASQ